MFKFPRVYLPTRTTKCPVLMDDVGKNNSEMPEMVPSSFSSEFSSHSAISVVDKPLP